MIVKESTRSRKQPDPAQKNPVLPRAAILCFMFAVALLSALWAGPGLSQAHPDSPQASEDRSNRGCKANEKWDPRSGQCIQSAPASARKISCACGYTLGKDGKCHKNRCACGYSLGTDGKCHKRPVIKLPSPK
jgi:hypothetical protein